MTDEFEKQELAWALDEVRQVIADRNREARERGSEQVRLTGIERAAMILACVIVGARIPPPTGVEVS